MAQTALYRHFDAQGRLLYVGVALNPVSRLASHTSGSSTWTDRIARVDVSYYPDRPAALQAEREVIAAEKPLHNVNGNSAAEKYRSPVTTMVSARIPVALLDAINTLALEDDMSRTDVIVQLLESALVARDEKAED